MVQELRTDDTPQVALVGKFAKDSCRGATHGVLKVHGIGQIDGKRQTIDDEIEPLAELMIASALFLVTRQEHQHDIKGIGIDDGRGVEKQAATEKSSQEIAVIDEMPEVVGIFKTIGNSRYLINEIDQQQIPYNGYCNTPGLLHHALISPLNLLLLLAG
jgi:hypothetical protein